MVAVLEDGIEGDPPRGGAGLGFSSVACRAQTGKEEAGQLDYITPLQNPAKENVSKI